MLETKTVTNGPIAKQLQDACADTLPWLISVSLDAMHTLMKAFRSFTSVVGIVVCIYGCATSGTDRVVQIGLNTYKMGGLGKSTDFSGSAVKARLYQQAAEFCR